MITHSIRRTLPAASLLVLSCLLIACKPSAMTRPGVPSELKHSWEVAFNRGDAAAVAALYEPDAQLMMSGAAPVRGRDNIQRAVEGMIKEGLKTRIDDEENVASGDFAYVFGKYHVLRGDGGPEVEHGAFVEIWHRRNDTWRIGLDVNAAEPVAPQ